MSDVNAALERYQETIAEANAVATAPGTDLVRTGGVAEAETVKAAQVEQRAAVLRSLQAADAAKAEMQKAIDEKKRELEQQMRDMEAMLEPVLKQAARLGDGINALNIYLGRDEDIEQLREGSRAAATEPIYVRQLVLAMDEESLVGADDDGMDATNIDEFVQWLLDSPAALHQVIPEQKSVVALIPRRKEKKYGNPWEDMNRNQQNRHTYWLVRNGECLWLTTTDFVVGDTTVPTPREFTDMFVVRDRFGDGTERHLEPGTDAWVKAEERADARTRHYMKVALLLEGLLDRTAAFHPHSGASFLSQADYDAGRIRVILDGESALTTGRPSFKDWQREKMSQLTEGMRVVGAFANRMRLHDSTDYGEAHVRPKGARPDNFVPYVVKATSRPYFDFQFTFDREYQRWSEDTYQYERKTGKGTGYFAHSAEWVLPLDLVTIAELETYLGARTERHDYLNMVPTLRAALRVLRAEQEEEAPFRAALIGRLGGNADLADELMRWYKTANKWHRALRADDEKAAKLILAEAARRARGGDTDNVVLAQLRDQYPEAVVIARRSSDYVVIEAEHRRYPNAPTNVFARMHIHGLRGGHKETRTWVTLTRAQVSRWTALHDTDAWSNWKLNPLPKTYLTDDDIDYVISEVTRQQPGTFIIRLGAYDGPHDIGVGPRGDYYTLDTDGEAQHSTFFCTWEGKDLRVHVRSPWSGDRPRYDEPRWETKWYGHLHSDSDVWLDEAKLADARAAWQARADEHKAARAIREHRNGLVMGIRAAWEKAAEQRLYDRFIEDFGDATLWEGHKKGLRMPAYPYDDYANGGGGLLHRILATLIDEGIEVAGLTVAEVAERAGVELDEVPEDLRDIVIPEGRTR